MATGTVADERAERKRESVEASRDALAAAMEDYAAAALAASSASGGGGPGACMCRH